MAGEGNLMTRIPLRKADAEDVAAIYERVTAAAGSVPNLYRVLAHSPELLDGWVDYAWRLRAEPTVDRGIRELAILRVAQDTGNDYVWRSHWNVARKSGVAEAKLVELETWPTSTAFSPPERAVLEVVDQATDRADVANEAWHVLREHFDEREVVELMLTIAWYCCVVRVVNTLGIPLEASHASVPPVQRTS
jgi:alkylhydroperoxidase family enzyme